MSIVYRGRDIDRTVRYHCDQSIVKMCLARAQILLTALHRYDIPAPYKPTYAKHPSVLWTGDSIDHQRWLIEFVKVLCGEATRRYEKITLRKRSSMSCHPSRSCLKPDGRKEPPQVMPIACKREDPFESYRKFYRSEKRSFAKWTKRPVPDFTAEG